MLLQNATRRGQDGARPQLRAIADAAMRFPLFLFDGLRQRIPVPANGRAWLSRTDYLLHKDGIGIRILDTARESERIDRLVSRRYRQRGYECSPRARDDRNRITLVACLGRRNVGTLTVNLDGPAGMDAEALFGNELAPFREAGARLCEFTRLALEIQDRERDALAYLFHSAFILAHRIHRASDLFIEVNPRHVPFYKRQLRFEVVSEQRLCQRVNAPALLMHKSLRETSDDLMRLGGIKAYRNRSFYASFLLPWEEKEVIERMHAAVHS